ncbi:hypothetical protein G7046_g3641 [Stylonectria norvegica]|nr:hypothetical protein G7046_g3641 [Stylonectria norvegica]
MGMRLELKDVTMLIPTGPQRNTAPLRRLGILAPLVISLSWCSVSHHETRPLLDGRHRWMVRGSSFAGTSPVVVQEIEPQPQRLHNAYLVSYHGTTADGAALCMQKAGAPRSLSEILSLDPLICG